MTHPTRFAHPPPLKVAVARISYEDMTRMCLAVNRAFGSGMAGRLMDLIVAARKEVARPDPLGDALNSGDGAYRP